MSFCWLGYSVTYISNKFKKLETCRVQQIILRHGFNYDVEYRFEKVILHNEFIVEYIMEANAGSKIFDCAYINQLSMLRPEN